MNPDGTWTDADVRQEGDLDLSRLRVTMLPSLTSGNPYLHLLATALRRAGVTVSFSPNASLRELARGSGKTTDVVHLHWHHRFFLTSRGRYLRWGTRTLRFFRDLAALRRSGVTVVWTVHNLVNHEKIGVPWELACCRRLARSTDAIIVHCEAAAQLVRHAYRVSQTPIAVIPHGHYLGAYPAAPTRAVAREALRIDPAKRVLLFFGQIRAYKGLEGLIEAFRAARETDLELVVVGQARDPRLALALQQAAAVDSRLRIDLEFVRDERLVTYLAACDAVVLPYADSLTSGSAVLAASLARAAVMPAIGCLREFPADAAYLYDPDQADGLRLAIADALAGGTDAAGERAFSYVRPWEWEEVARRTLTVYERGAA